MASAEEMVLEIQTESLQKLLTRVRQQSQPGLMGIPSLDAYLSTVESDSPVISSEPPGHVIRIQGPPGSGKTHILYYLVATSVLPTNKLSSCIGGWNKVAFVVDLDGHFQTARFRQILVDRLKRIQLEAVSIPVTVEQCMKSVHVFRPSTSVQFAVTLAHIHDYHTKNFPHQELGMIAIHSIDAFYWIDRFKSEQLLSNLTKTTYFEAISSILVDLRISYGLTTAITLWRPPTQINQVFLHNHATEEANNAGGDSLSLTPDLPAATVVLDSTTSEEDCPCGTKFMWRGQAHSRLRSCHFSCVIDDKGVLMH